MATAAVVAPFVATEITILTQNGCIVEHSWPIPLLTGPSFIFSVNAGGTLKKDPCLFLLLVPCGAQTYFFASAPYPFVTLKVVASVSTKKDRVCLFFRLQVLRSIQMLSSTDSAWSEMLLR